MARKIALFVAALIIPGGFIALFGAYLLKLMHRSERGRKVVDYARQRVPAWASAWRVSPMPQRQAA